MPGFDGTGPIGKGPFTGRGMGYCIVKLDSKKYEIQNSQGKEVIDMPRGDGTGPMGLGPMTGRAAGYCAGYSVPGYANPIPGRGWGFGYGRGFGRGRGWGRGFGRGFGWTQFAYPYAYGNPYMAPSYLANITPKQEADILKNEATALKEQLEDIQSRIETLEKAQTQESKDE